MFNFVKATLDLLLGFIDGAIDYLIDLLISLLIDGIPELKTLFAPFNFDMYWDKLINEHIKAGKCFCLRFLRASCLTALVAHSTNYLLTPFLFPHTRPPYASE